MAKIICIIGNKGGTGKTTLSHLLAHGLGLFGKYTVAVLTDIERQPLARAGRNYLPFDARQTENLARVVRKLRSVDNWYGVIDGGGNRPQMDTTLAALADLVLLPFRDSHEDIRTLVQDLERFPAAYALPSQWPSNPWQLQAATRTLNDLLGDFRDRILEPVHAQSATKLLLQHEVPAQLPAALNNTARMLALQVMELAGIPLPEDRWLPVPRQSASQDDHGFETQRDRAA
jgi:cellulose biosynthesis protein BcsQ